ncbi:ABC-type dipeptide transport system, periplasmic component [Corynebacterium mustelae]|uniref:ABC-type dipeptide transport system, periplasmic component n=1 Tax=Corynebacterium mustelae TaxID=571915 RepID=A0A0G3GUF4_9CORY|nr:ABC transporter family substrate-binding protein [Corynebacterium mustelae]AKK04774.1 ABC-type dipeptide transport system, periplasmic component [Corynebacterium mustelae]
MKRNFRVSAVAALSVLALGLGACSNTGTDGSSSSEKGGAAVEIKLSGDYNPLERDQIKDGGELTLPLDEFSEQQNRFHGNATRMSTDLWKWYNPQVTLMDGDGTWHANPDYLVETKDEVVDGKLVLTWKIHPDAVFNDGTPIDWTAFETTWKMNNGSNEEVVPNGTDGYELIESVAKGANDKEVVITFQGTYPWWQGLFGYVLHPAVSDAKTFNEAYLNKLLPEWGAGPFTVDTYDAKNGTVTFVPNDKWWGDKPKLDKVHYRYMEDQAMINAFQAGEIDAAGVGNKDNLAKAKAMGDKIEIRGALQPANSLLTLNGQAPILSDIKVREAILTGFDRSQIAAIRFNGLDYEEKLPGSFTFYQTQEGYEDNLGQVLSYDPEKAKKLLDEAGWTEGSDGVREKDGEKLSLRYTVVGDSPLLKGMASATQKMLKDIGVEVKVEERPSSDFSKITTEKDFDLFPMGFSSSDPFGAAYFGQTWLSDSELNKSGTGTPELDEKIRALQKLPTAEEQIAEANKLEKEAFARFGIVPIYNGPQLVGVKKGLANFGAHSFATLPREDIGWAKDAS